MQCFQVGYRGICHASLVFFVPSENLWKFWKELARKSPRISENFGNASNLFLMSSNDYFTKLLEHFGNSSKVFSRCFYDFLKFSENLRKCSEIFRTFQKTSEIVQIEVIFRCFMVLLNFRKIFGSVRKFSENFRNGSKVIFRCFYDFLKFLENLRKCSEIFENFPDVNGNVRNGS